jgi:4'-phosphopantetheinyl transferase
MTDNPRRPTQNQPGQFLSALHSQPLTAPDLHIWCASLSASRDELSRFSSLLSADEKARAEKFYFERDSNRYIVGRGILRLLLGSYLKMEASRIEFTYGPHGKPAVETIFQNKVLQFNLSHSNDQAVYIFGWDTIVGIDIEHIRPMQDADDFAEQFYSPRERALINSLSGDEKWAAFFKIWTCKEAFLKANGSGLTISLDQIEIHPQADGSAKITFAGEGAGQATDWRIETFEPVTDYQGAIAIAGHAGRIIFRQLEGL